MKNHPHPIGSAGPFQDREKRLVYWAAALSTLAGLIHAWFAPEHFEEWVGYGGFFVMVAAAQILFSVLLLSRKPTRLLLWAGVMGNVLIMMLYLLTRTHGIPIGPHSGEIEPVGGLDALATLNEIVLTACLLLLLRTQLRFGTRQNHGAYT